MTGAELRARREALKLTQADFHAKSMETLGKKPFQRPIATSTVSRWENDRVRVPVWMEMVLRLIEAAE